MDRRPGAGARKDNEWPKVLTGDLASKIRTLRLVRGKGGSSHLFVYMRITTTAEPGQESVVLYPAKSQGEFRKGERIVMDAAALDGNRWTVDYLRKNKGPSLMAYITNTLDDVLMYAVKPTDVDKQVVMSDTKCDEKDALYILSKPEVYCEYAFNK